MKETRGIVDIKRKNGTTIQCPYCKKKVSLRFIRKKPEKKERTLLQRLGDVNI